MPNVLITVKNVKITTLLYAIQLHAFQNMMRYMENVFVNLAPLKIMETVSNHVLPNSIKTLLLDCACLAKVIIKKIINLKKLQKSIKKL